MYKHPSNSSKSRRHGSVLILVVAAIAMLAFLGGLFLTSTHTQRTVTPDAGSNRSSSRQTDVNVVLESVNDEIARQIKADVFNPADAATRPGVAFDIEAGVELSDRPWISARTGIRRTPDFDGSPNGAAVVGGYLDDTWLASTFPHQVNGDPANPWVWSRITSLTGGSFRVTDEDGSLTSGNDRRVRNNLPGGEPAADFFETAVTAGETYNIPAYAPASPGTGAPLLVDADGDGVPDSRFERAPIAARDGIEYFMAVRIIDLASLLNVDTATTALDFDARYFPDPEGPQARGPGDLDAGQFLAVNAPEPTVNRNPYNGAADPDQFLREFVGEGGPGGIPGLLNYRGGVGVDTPGLPPDAEERVDLYKDAGPYVDSSGASRRLSADFERELRYRNGVYDLPEPGPLRDFAPQLTVEPRDQYSRGGGQLFGVRNEALPGDEVERYYGYERMLEKASGSLAHSPSPPPPTQPSYNARAPRAYLTTRSASNRWMVPLPGEAASATAASPGLQDKFDLNDVALRPTKTTIGTGGLVSGNRFPTYAAGDAELEKLEIALRGGTVGTPPANASDLDGVAGLAYRSAAAPGSQADPSTSKIMGGGLIPNSDRPVLPQSSVVAATLPAPAPGTIAFNPATLERFSLQFAANLQDYRDADNRLTRLAIPGSGGQSVYGMEALPAINEVYAHRLYEAVSSVDNGGTFDIEWDQRGTVGYAIEIINPHNRPISLQNVHAFIVWDDAGLTDETYLGELADLAENEVAATNAGTPADDPNTVFDERRMLQPGQTIVIYRDAVSAGGDTSNDANLPVLPLIDLAATPTTTVSDEAFRAAPNGDAAVDWPKEVDSGNYINVRVELRAEQMEQSLTSFPNATGGGGILPFAYQAAPCISLPDNWTQPDVAEDYAAAGRTPEQKQGFLQVTSQGSSDGINPLLLAANRFTFDASPAALNNPTPGPQETVRAPRPPLLSDPAGTGAMFDLPETLGTAKPALANYKEIAASAGQMLLSDAPQQRLSSVGPIAAMLIVGPQERTGTSPTSGRTVAEVIDHVAPTALFEPKLEDLMLTLDAGTPAPTPPAAGRVIDTRLAPNFVPDWRIPHFIHLLDSFRVDDKVTPGTDNPTFAGALNLNTVRLPMLADVLPVVDGEARRRMAAIVGDRLRDYDTTVDDGRSQPGGGINPPEPGISAVLDVRRASGGDFFASAPPYSGADDFELASTVINGGGPSAAFRVDRVPHPLVAPDADGVIDDREESMLAADILNSVTTTRSDVFCAYILIHGYKSDDIGAGPVKVLRSITLFDRSQMKTVEDDVKVEVLMRLAESPKR